MHGLAFPQLILNCFAWWTYVATIPQPIYYMYCIYCLNHIYSIYCNYCINYTLLSIVFILSVVCIRYVLSIYTIVSEQRMLNFCELLYTTQLFVRNL